MVQRNTVTITVLSLMQILQLIFSLQGRCSGAQDNIELACQAAQFPELCKTCLDQEAKLPANAGAQEIVWAAINLCRERISQIYQEFSTMMRVFQNFPNITFSVSSCMEGLVMSQRYLSKINDGAQLGNRIKDVQAWLGFSLNRFSGCSSSLRVAPQNAQVLKVVNSTMTAMNITSNALSMVNALDVYGSNMALWKPPVTERSGSAYKMPCSSVFGIWDPANYEFNVTLKADVVVSKDNFSMTIQEAVNRAPDNSKERFVIYVKQGVYKEIVQIPPGKDNIMLIGDGMNKTVITGSLKVSEIPGNITTYTSATFAVNADGFIARNIAFENTAGPPTTQAVALRVSGDLAAFYDSAMLGNQDTLYAQSLRQYYRNCRIEGNVDFIFGNAAAVFENCLILLRPRQDKPATKGTEFPITAHGRIDPAQTTGLIFKNCTIDGTETFIQGFNANQSAFRVFLGRPWKMYSRAIFMNTYLGKIIDPKGWTPWNGDFALQTLYFGEAENKGPRADVSGRVNWSSVVPATNVGMYSTKCFIQTA